MLPSESYQALGCLIFIIASLPLIYMKLPQRLEIPWAVGLLAFGVAWTVLMGLANATLPAHFV